MDARRFGYIGYVPAYNDQGGLGMGKRLWVERNKDGSWDAFSDDGAHIKFG